MTLIPIKTQGRASSPRNRSNLLGIGNDLLARKEAARTAGLRRNLDDRILCIARSGNAELPRSVVKAPAR
jgi:hypothetical protein